MRTSERKFPAYRRIKKATDLLKEWDIPTTHVHRLLMKRRRIAIRSGKAQGQPVVYKNQLLYFIGNKYIAEPEQLWLIESVIGSKAVAKALPSNKKIDDGFIETLFGTASFFFYLSSDEAYLLGYDDELTQSDFGPLIKISALAALQRFGLAALEQAKEKTAVRL